MKLYGIWCMINSGEKNGVWGGQDNCLGARLFSREADAISIMNNEYKPKWTKWSFEVRVYRSFV